jgi:hypothetical protein
MKNGLPATPEQVMGTCLRLELEASALYRRFEAATLDPALKALWSTMSKEETRHAQFIDRLAANRQLVVPALSHDLLTAMVERVEAIRHEADTGELDDERMLSVAAALEFSEMDDLFGAICRTAGVDPEAGRGDHLAPLVEAVMARKTSGGVLRHLLAAMIRLQRRAPADAAPAAAAMLDDAGAQPARR